MSSTKVAVIVNSRRFLYSHRASLFDYLQSRGFDITVFSSHTIPEENHFFGEIKLASEDGHTMFLRGLISHYRRLREYENFHIVGLVPLLLFLFIYGVRFRKANILVSITGLGWVFTSAKSIFALVVKRFLRFFRKREGIHFIFQNPDDRELFLSIGFSRKKTSIIQGSGLDLSKFSFKELAPTIRPLQFVMVARLVKDKGVNEYLSAARECKRRFPDLVKFSLVGDLDSKNPTSLTLADIEKIRNEGQIDCKGYEVNISRLISDAHFVVLPSYREGFPRVLIEAMAIGRPIITTDVPGCKECVSENGFLVRPRDSADLLRAFIDALSLSDSELDEMSRNSVRMFKENLDPDLILRKHGGIYESLF